MKHCVKPAPFYAYDDGHGLTGFLPLSGNRCDGKGFKTERECSCFSFPSGQAH